MQICQNPHVIFESTSQFSFKFCISLQCTIQYASIYNFASIYNIIYVAWSFWRGGSFEGGPKLPLDETRYEEVLIKKVFYLTQRKYQENQGSIKVGLSPSIKNCSYLLQWKPFKNDEKCFLFHLKSFFCSQDI